MQLIYLHRDLYNQISDILYENVTYLDYEKEILDIVIKEIKSDDFEFLDGNLLHDKKNKFYYKIIIL